MEKIRHSELPLTITIRLLGLTVCNIYAHSNNPPTNAEMYDADDESNNAYCTQI